MRLRFVTPALAALAIAGLAACTGTPAPGNSPSSSAPTGTTTNSPTSSATQAPSSSATDGSTPTQVPTSVGPSEPNPSLPPATPGQGNAELSIKFLAAADAAPQNYTLVCSSGVPAAESKHPTAAAACEALKNHPALLSPTTPTDQNCTMQYGGPETATVTGSVDGKEVNVTFNRTDGCRIAQWDAASAILGASGGAA
ncbi:SSI family serine proteinase inhibitor [Paenarthrobacter sp. S56]|uniref:SSI family serine proteinase inhibitor n=1 Tax=Paenarthrobacter sp. S56 TaxID=3138179 RepID=UPI00321BC4E3